MAGQSPHFDFKVSGMTLDEADDLLARIQEAVNDLGLVIGEGFLMEDDTEAADEPQA